MILKIAEHMQCKILMLLCIAGVIPIALPYIAMDSWCYRTQHRACEDLVTRDQQSQLGLIEDCAMAVPDHDRRCCQQSIGVRIEACLNKFCVSFLNDLLHKLMRQSTYSWNDHRGNRRLHGFQC